MLTKKWVVAIVLCLVVGHGTNAEEVKAIDARQLAAQPMATGSAREVLPASGALLHLQVHDILSVLEGVEEILVSGVPEKLLPPDAQELFRTEHPVLTLVGLQAFQQPLTRDLFEEQTGLNSRGTATLTLYLGDPRRMFILSLPAGSREPLSRMVTAVLRPSVVEETELGGRQVLRVISPRIPFAPELYLVTSEEALFLCGDRSLAIALFETPATQRMGQDGFLSRAVPSEENHQLRLVLNPASIKPFAMQLQAVRGIASMLIPQQRRQLLDRLPAEAREQFEIQVQSQLGVRDLEQFAEYAECVLLATLEQLTDSVTSHAAAFEGLTITASLKGKFDQFSLKLHSQRFEDGNGTAAIPLDEVRRALAWLGPDHQSFSVTGRKPEPKDYPVLAAWTQRVQSKFEARGLESAGLSQLVRLLEERRSIPTVESRAPWTLTVQAPLRPLPDIESAATVEEYFTGLDLPVWRRVQVVGGRDKAFLEDCFREETEALNRNRRLTMDFIDSFQKQRRLFERVNRFEVASQGDGVTRYVRESSWTTRGGLFGYDQHELVNRKIIWARQLGDYLVYHRGAMASTWLAELKGGGDRGVVSGVSRLLDRVPDGPSSISVNRILVGLPALVDWVDAIEGRLHADVREYLEEAQAIVDASPELEQAKRQLRELRMPFLVGSVSLNPEDRRVYALLPAGDAALTLPRTRLVPLIQELLADFAGKADDVGGSVSYTKQGGGSWEFTAMQSWEALTLLTRTLGNSLADQYLGSAQGQQALQQRLAAPRDMDATVFDEVVARNPNWRFIPQPQPRIPAKPGKPIPARSPDASEQMVDLTAHYNAVLNETWHLGGLSNNTLEDLAAGLHEFDGTVFDVRGIVQLAGTQANRELRVKFPVEVEGISVGQVATRLRFLHACGWPSPQGTRIGSYVLHYANGERRELPIIYGTHVQDWWLNEPVGPGSGLQVAWEGKNHASANGPAVGLFLTTWDNPWPDQRIVSIDYRSAMANSAPFLIAITLE
jgi:hypothetical protein